MNFREIREANKLIDELKKIDSFIIDAQSSARTLKICTSFNEVTLDDEHKIKAMQVILGIRGELARKLKELGVTEE